ncbi:uricase [Phellopilus nigrolimitatus]|nr:uricase [Phellopilus nigrolimitatus]
MSAEVGLAAARYGKDKVRVFRVVKSDKWHDVVEYNVCTLVEGAIETSFTQADNSVVVATDSIKNITYYMAKTSPFVLVPELFAIHLGAFLVGKYAHLRKAFVTVEQLRWQRIAVDGKSHPHSFWRDGDEKRVTSVEIDATAGKDAMTAKVASGASDLLVLKSSGSAFENFVRDEFTTLVEVNDRIFSTSVDLQYVFRPLALGAHAGLAAALAKIKEANAFDAVAARARAITLDVFATDESASVQATLYKMAGQIVNEHTLLERASYALPNKHYIPVDMKYLGIDNTTPTAAEVFCPIAAPSGLITATVIRK